MCRHQANDEVIETNVWTMWLNNEGLPLEVSDCVVTVRASTDLVYTLPHRHSLVEMSRVSGLSD